MNKIPDVYEDIKKEPGYSLDSGGLLCTESIIAEVIKNCCSTIF